jgi:hypothetical protein
VPSDLIAVALIFIVWPFIVVAASFIGQSPIPRRARRRRPF